MTTSEYTVKNLLSKSREFLEKKGINGNTRLDAELLLAHILKLDRLKLFLNQDKVLSDADTNTYREYIVRRSKKEPVAYILGFKDFLGLKFDVNRDVLIPRPETEELTAMILQNYVPEEIIQRRNDEQDKNKTGFQDGNLTGLQDGNLTGLQDLKNSNIINVLDLCCGSGCIGVTLKKFRPSWNVCFIDKSASALEITKKNYLKIICEGAFEAENRFFLSDLFADFPDINKERIDIIVTNPPYIFNHEKSTLADDIVKYEPHEALFLENPAELLLKIIRDGIHYLKAGGELYMEGTPELLSELEQKSQALGYQDIQLIKDLCGKTRFLRLKK